MFGMAGELQGKTQMLLITKAETLQEAKSEEHLTQSGG